MSDENPRPVYELRCKDGTRWAWGLATLQQAQSERARLDDILPSHAPFQIIRVTETREEVT